MSYVRHQRYHGFLRFDTLPYRLDLVFQMSYLRYQRYPSILRFRYHLTIPARSGVFNSHTHDTHAYPGMEYPGYIPGVCRVRYLTRGSCGDYSPHPLTILHGSPPRTLCQAAMLQAVASSSGRLLHCGLISLLGSVATSSAESRRESCTGCHCLYVDYINWTPPLLRTCNAMDHCSTESV